MKKIIKNHPHILLDGLEFNLTFNCIIKSVKTDLFPRSAFEIFSHMIYFTVVSVPYNYNPSELVIFLFISLEKC